VWGVGASLGRQLDRRCGARPPWGTARNGRNPYILASYVMTCPGGARRRGWLEPCSVRPQPFDQGGETER
jgi:hypothetical protein